MWYLTSAMLSDIVNSSTKVVYNITPYDIGYLWICDVNWIDVMCCDQLCLMLCYEYDYDRKGNDI